MMVGDTEAYVTDPCLRQLHVVVLLSFSFLFPNPASAFATKNSKGSSMPTSLASVSRRSALGSLPLNADANQPTTASTKKPIKLRPSTASTRSTKSSVSPPKRPLTPPTARPPPAQHHEPKRRRSTPSKVVSPATLDRAALAGVFSAAILSPNHDDDLPSLWLAHARFLRLSREPRLSAFAARAHEAIETGVLALSSSNDLVLDVGLQALMRETLETIHPIWRLPAMATIISKPPSSDLISHFAGKFPRADDAARRAALRKLVLQRLISLLALLDEAATSALLPPSAPALFLPTATHTSSEKLLHHVQRTFLAKQGDVVITLRKLGAPLAYTQPCALTAPSPSFPLEASSLEMPLTLTHTVLVLRSALHHRPEVGRSLAAKLHAPPKQQWQRKQNAEAMLVAVERIGATHNKLPSAAQLIANDDGAWRALLWACARHALIPSLAPEGSVRAEIRRLCAPHLSPPGAVDGVLPVAGMLETAGADGALLLWLRTAARAGGLSDAACGSLQWRGLFGWSQLPLLSVAKAYGAPCPYQRGASPAYELLEIMRTGDIATVSDEVAAAAAAVLYAGLTVPAAHQRAARRLQSRFVNRRASRILTQIRHNALATRVQARVRGMHARRGMQTTLEAISTLRGWVASVVARRRLRSMRSAAIKLQAAARRHRARDVLMNSVDAANTIQEAVRPWVRVMILMRDAAACLLAATARKRAACVAYAKARRAAVTLQAVARGRHAMQSYIKSRELIVVAQAHIRMAIARVALGTARTAATRLQAAARRRRAHSFLVTARDAATRVQATARRLAARRLAACLLVARRQWAAVTVQAGMRGAIARSKMRLATDAATRVQAVWRMRMHRIEMMAARHAVVRLQAASRRLSCQRQLAAGRSAATVMQSAMRRRVALALVKRLSAARAVQAAWRGVVARIWVEALHMAATDLQAAIRMRLARVAYMRARCAAISLQAMARTAAACAKLKRGIDGATALAAVSRGLLVRTRLRLERLAATHVQAAARALPCREHMKRCRMAATRLQAATRQKRVLALYAKHRASGVAVQSWARGLLARRTAHRLRAAVKLQAMVRMARARHALAVACASAVVIEAAARRMAARQRLNTALASATALQAKARRRIAVKHLHAAQMASTRLQARVRARNARVRFALAMAAVGYLQSQWRWRIAHRHLVIAHFAATLMQAKARQRRAAGELRLAQSAATIVQALARGVCVRAAIGRKRAAARDVQCSWRRRVAMANLVCHRSAAITTQASVRRVQSVRMARTRLAAVITLQTARRVVLDQRLLASLQRRHAATSMAAAWRMHKARTALTRSRGAALTMQANTRRRLVSLRITAMHHAAIPLQSAARRNAAVTLRTRAVQAATVMATHARRHAAMKSKIHARSRRDAATRLQSTARGVHARTLLSRRHAAATVITARVRGRNDHISYAFVQLAVNDIQRIGRGAIARRSAHRRTKSLVSVQASTRGRAARRRAMRMRAARAVQAIVRGRNARALATRLAAACTLQAAYRRHAAMLSLRRARTAAAALQRTWRARLLLRRAAAVVVRLQRAARRFLHADTIPHRRRVLRACAALHRNHRVIEPAKVACTALSVLHEHGRCRIFAIDLSLLPRLLMVIGSCNRSTHSLALLRLALPIATCLVADANCRARINSYAPHLSALPLPPHPSATPLRHTPPPHPALCPHAHTSPPPYPILTTHSLATCTGTPSSQVGCCALSSLTSPTLASSHPQPDASSPPPRTRAYASSCTRLPIRWWGTTAVHCSHVSRVAALRVVPRPRGPSTASHQKEAPTGCHQREAAAPPQKDHRPDGQCLSIGS